MPSHMNMSFVVVPVYSKNYERYLFTIHNTAINKPVRKNLFKTFTKEIFKHTLGKPYTDLLPSFSN